MLKNIYNWILKYWIGVLEQKIGGIYSIVLFLCVPTAAKYSLPPKGLDFVKTISWRYLLVHSL